MTDLKAKGLPTEVKFTMENTGKARSALLCAEAHKRAIERAPMPGGPQ
jgi:hypothetical protein